MNQYSRDYLFLDEAGAMRQGRRIAAWRALHGVPAQVLAKELGLDKYALSRIEHAVRPLPVALALRICGHLGIAVNGNGVEFDESRLRLKGAPATTGR